MFHTNAGELHQLFSTFNRVWGAGGAASLSLKTVDGKVSAVLDVQLGPPADLRPGAPEVKSHAAGGVHQQRGQQQRRRHRGPKKNTAILSHVSLSIRPSVHRCDISPFHL